MDMVQLGVVTIVGYVGSEPAIFDKAKGAICSFRLGCTRGYYDAAHVWRSFPTTWITVKTFRRLAEHVHRSVRKGDPVIVTGQLNTEVWTQEDAERSRLVIEASSVGHDLNCGNAMFYKDDKTARGVQRDAGSDGRTAESAGNVGPLAATSDAPAVPVEIDAAGYRGADAAVPRTAPESYGTGRGSDGAGGTTANIRQTYTHTEGAGQLDPDGEQEEFADSGF